MFRILSAATLALAFSLAVSSANAGPREDIINAFKAQAGAEAVNADIGKDIFLKTYSTGKPDTPQCTTCHDANPHKSGLTRTGKPIDPMAVSTTPDRYTDPEKVDKWFRRNCTSVIGRECTAAEKASFLMYMSAQ